MCPDSLSCKKMEFFVRSIDTSRHRPHTLGTLKGRTEMLHGNEAKLIASMMNVLSPGFDGASYLEERAELISSIARVKSALGCINKSACEAMGVPNTEPVYDILAKWMSEV